MVLSNHAYPVFTHDHKGLIEMSDQQIKHMVDRFLSWRLPENFNPDGGISFKKTFNEHTAHPMKHEPTGTNLFDATHADAMVRHMVEGLIDAPRRRNWLADRAWRPMVRSSAAR